jgi:hypothetical protein
LSYSKNREGQDDGRKRIHGQRWTHLPVGGCEQEVIDPFTAFAIAQGAVAGIKKQ